MRVVRLLSLLPLNRTKSARGQQVWQQRAGSDQLTAHGSLPTTLVPPAKIQSMTLESAGNAGKRRTCQMAGRAVAVGRKTSSRCGQVHEDGGDAGIAVRTH